MTPPLGPSPQCAGNLTEQLVNLDMLGSFASSGVELFARQQLPTGGNGSSPQFWCSILFKKLMGTSVFNVSMSSGHLVRAYAHSTPSFGASHHHEL